jgi:hypothetical protein
MSYGHQLTEEEMTKCNWVDRPRLLWMEDQELLDDWMIPLVEEVVGILEKAHQLFESGQFQRERILNQFEHTLMTAITELKVVKGWKVLKEGSQARQSAHQQADCGKIDLNTRQSDVGEKKICRCESCDVCYYRWRQRHE